MTDGEGDKSSAWVTGFKEIVTAGLGIVIIMATIILLWPPLSKSPVDTTSAQGIFAILGGWGGVILGYYFGRLPAEKAADKANAAANTARNQRDDAEKTKTLALASCINKLENTEKSLRDHRDTLDRLNQPQLAPIIKEIDVDIAELYAERQKVQDMAK